MKKGIGGRNFILKIGKELKRRNKEIEEKVKKKIVILIKLIEKRNKLEKERKGIGRSVGERSLIKSGKGGWGKKRMEGIGVEMEDWEKRIFVRIKKDWKIVGNNKRKEGEIEIGDRIGGSNNIGFKEKEEREGKWEGEKERSDEIIGNKENEVKVEDLKNKRNEDLMRKDKEKW